MSLHPGERGNLQRDLLALPLSPKLASGITETVLTLQKFACTEKPLASFQNKLEENSPTCLSLFIPVASRSLTENKTYKMLVVDLCGLKSGQNRCYC